MGWFSSGSLKLKPALVLVTILMASSLTNATPSANTQSDPQLALYQQALKLTRYRQHQAASELRQQLANHPLYPYLVKAELEQQLSRYPVKEAEEFLSLYSNTAVGEQFRRQWLNQLAKGQRWQDYLNVYQAAKHPNVRSCWYLEALHQTGHPELALQQTRHVWLSGQSLPSACDRPLKRWQQAGLLTDDLVWQRLQLALKQDNYRLASYLARRSGEAINQQARQLVKLYRQPEQLKNVDSFIGNHPYTGAVVSYGLKQLAAHDIELASQLWLQYRAHQVFDPQQLHDTRHVIGRHLIASNAPSTLAWLLIHDPNAQDSFLLEWRIRLGIKEQRWRDAARWISLLSLEQQNLPRWRYWQARSYQELPHLADIGYQQMSALAELRTYYGFLAAQRIGVPYRFNHTDLPVTDNQHVAAQPAIARAKALLQLNEINDARREWFYGTRSLPQHELIAASVLAHQWGWHQQAIHTVLKAQHTNDLAVRFPLAHRDTILAQAKQQAIPAEWIYAITRQESAFATDARSSVGAKGLMQLRPGTAKDVAKSMGLRISSRDLYQAEINLTLGSHYLQQLLQRFNGNRILATAAYNAGPKRLENWLKKQQQSMPYDIWIETLPYYETRNYIQNVLAFSIIYGHRFNTTLALVEPHEQWIDSAMTTTALSRKP